MHIIFSHSVVLSMNSYFSYSSSFNRYHSEIAGGEDRDSHSAHHNQLRVSCLKDHPLSFLFIYTRALLSLTFLGGRGLSPHSWWNFLYLLKPWCLLNPDIPLTSFPHWCFLATRWVHLSWASREIAGIISRSTDPLCLHIDTSLRVVIPGLPPGGAKAVERQMC